MSFQTHKTCDSSSINYSSFMDVGSVKISVVGFCENSVFKVNVEVCLFGHNLS